MLYLGFNTSGECKCSDTCITNVKIVKNVAHAYIINKKFYNTLIDEVEQCQAEIDTCYVDLQNKYNIYGIYPSLISQIASYSDICNRNVNYTTIILDNSSI